MDAFHWRRKAGWGMGMLLALSQGCIVKPDARDFWSEIISACDYQVAGGSSLQNRTEPETPPSLRSDCAQALERILPFDESFTQAPSGMKERVLEGFQVLAAYPLALPREGRILGKSRGGIPAIHLCAIGAPSCPPALRPESPAFELGNYRKNLFNAVVNAFEMITYDPSDNRAQASNGFHLAAGVNGRVLAIHPPFWNTESVNELFKGSFGRAGTLVHEAWHSEGFFHSLCPDSGRPECDAELSGSYGFSVTYNTLLIQGSAGVHLPGGAPILSNLDLMGLGYQTCSTLKKRVLNLPRELKELIESKDCLSVTADWTLAAEGIRR
jgi:hypothetical protein